MELIRIPETVVPGKRLGRHISHDPRSRRYRPSRALERRSVQWRRTVPAFDQGELGSCGGNGGVGVIATEPFVHTVPANVALGEPLAVAVYSDATHLDEFDGAYTPTDTGTSGLAVAKALKNRGLVSGYLSAMVEAEIHGAIQAGPILVGSYWYEGMDEPDSQNMVHVSGNVRGGHLYEILAFDLTTDRWTGINSWGTEWGQAGYFSIGNDDFLGLVANHGDVTQFVPATEPAPVPTPDLTRITRSFSSIDYDVLDEWAKARHYGSNKVAQQAWLRGANS